MSESKQDVLRQIQEAWKLAHRQLEELRASVEKTGQMANLKVQAEFLARDLDRAFRDLGAAVWAQSKKGNLDLPSTVKAQVRAVQEAEAQQAASKRSINELLSEGAEVAGKLRAEKKQSGAKVVASKGKKR